MSAPTIELPPDVLSPMTDQAFSVLLDVDLDTADILAGLTAQEYAIASKRALDLHPEAAMQAAAAIVQEEDDPDTAKELVADAKESLEGLIGEAFILATESNRRRFADSLGVSAEVEAEMLTTSGDESLGPPTGFIPIDLVSKETEPTEEASSDIVTEDGVDTKEGDDVEAEADLGPWIAKQSLKELNHVKRNPIKLTQAEAEVILAGMNAAIEEAREVADRSTELVTIGAIKFVFDHMEVFGHSQVVASAVQ